MDNQELAKIVAEEMCNRLMQDSQFKRMVAGAVAAQIDIWELEEKKVIEERVRGATGPILQTQIEDTVRRHLSRVINVPTWSAESVESRIRAAMRSEEAMQVRNIRETIRHTLRGMIQKEFSVKVRNVIDDFFVKD